MPGARSTGCQTPGTINNKFLLQNEKKYCNIKVGKGALGGEEKDYDRRRITEAGSKRSCDDE